MATRHSASMDAKMKRWSHNGLMGCAAMIKSHCIRIQQASTTTPEAKALAVEIEGLAELLSAKLKTRVD